MAGLALVATGAIVLSLLVVVSNCSGDLCDRWTIRLGLAGGALASLYGLAALMIGGWIIWRGGRGSPRT